MDIEIKLEGVKEALDLVDPKRIRKIIAETLYQTAQDTKTGLRNEMEKVFDRPVPYLLRSLNIRSPGYSKWSAAASRDSLGVIVGFETFGTNNANELLKPQVFGGSRPMKRSEQHLASYWVPGKALPLNQYGNPSGPKIVQILSALRAFPEGGYSMNRPKQLSLSLGKRTKTPKNYIVVRSESKQKLRPGVYEKLASGKLKPMLMFIQSPTYHKRFKFLVIINSIQC